MKCPHCGKEISEFAISCPNCGGNPKGQATEEVKEKVKIVAQKRNNLNNKLSIIGVIISFAVAIIIPYFFTRIMYLGLNRIVECILYAIVAVVVIVIAKKCNAFKSVSKNKVFYILSAVVAIADFVLQNEYYKYLLGSDTIDLMRQKLKLIWVIFNIAKLLHILVLVVGIAFLFTVIKQKKESKA